MEKPSVTDGMVTYPVVLNDYSRQLADSFLAQYADVRTLCNVIRDIARLSTDNTAVMDLCREAVLMGKKLDEKIRQQDPTYDNGMWAREIRNNPHAC
jgi:hypothetical protein